MKEGQTREERLQLRLDRIEAVLKRELSADQRAALLKERNVRNLELQLLQARTEMTLEA